MDLRDDGPFANRWFWLLALALLAHLFLARLPTSRFVLVGPSNTKEPVAVELFNKRPVVMTERSPVDPLHDDNKPADNAGEFRNRTDRETHAEQKGAFREFRTGGTGARSAEQSRSQASRQLRGKGDVEISRIESLKISDLMPQNSASPNTFSDTVAAGVRTVLNTDSVAHAGFLNRVADSVYDSWFSNTKMAIERMRIEGKTLETNAYVTRVIVEIDTDGNLRDVRLAGGSGVSLLDDAPKKAFWDNQPYRNPPKAMFRGEPTVQFGFEFTLMFKRSGFSLGGP